jgi:hypothetical protein
MAAESINYSKKAKKPPTKKGQRFSDMDKMPNGQYFLISSFSPIIAAS